MQDIVRSVVKEFPSRVIKNRNYEAKNEPSTRLGTSSRFRLKAVSSSDTDADATKRTFKAPLPRMRQPVQEPPAAASDETAPIVTEAHVVVDPSPVANPTQDIPELRVLLAAGSVPVTFEEADVTAQVPDDPPAIRPSTSTPVRASISSTPTHLSSGSQSDGDALFKKVDYLHKNVAEKLSRMNGTIAYLATKMEDIATAQADIKGLLNSYVSKTTTEEMMESPDFPFTAYGQLEQYIQDYPDGKHLMERYIYTPQSSVV